MPGGGGGGGTNPEPGGGGGGGGPAPPGGGGGGGGPPPPGGGGGLYMPGPGGRVGSLTPGITPPLLEIKRNLLLFQYINNEIKIRIKELLPRFLKKKLFYLVKIRKVVPYRIF